MSPRLQGGAVELRPLRVDDAAELWPAAADPATWTYMMFDVRSRADLEAWIRQRLAPVAGGTAHAFAQVDCANGNAVGSTSIFDITPHRTMEVGHTWIAPNRRKSGFNTQAKRLILGYCFEELGAIRVQLKCDERNTASRAAIERLGAVYEGTIRNQAILPGGGKRQARVYSILDNEWPTVRARLDARLRRESA